MKKYFNSFKLPLLTLIKNMIVKISKSVYCHSDLILWAIDLKKISKPTVEAASSISLKVVENRDLIAIKKDLGRKLWKLSRTK